MAGKILDASQSVSAGSVSRIFKKEMLQECAALSLLLVVAFLVLAIVSYDPADVAGAVYPVNEQPNNLGGRTGAVVIEHAYTFLGVGTYLLVGVLGVYGTLIFFRRKAADWPVRLLGSALLVFAFSALFGASYAESGVMPSRGGVVGVMVFSMLDANFGLTGTYLVLGFVALLSFLLATDMLFYPLIRDLLHPLGADNSVSGPVEAAEIPAPLESEPADPAPGRTWLERLLKRDREEAQEQQAAPVPDVADEEEVDEEDEDEATVEFVADSEFIPNDAPAQPAPVKPVRQAAVRAAAPKAEEPEQKPDWDAALKAYKVPEVVLLNQPKKKDPANAKAELQRAGEIIKATFAAFHIAVEVVGATRGPTVTTFDIQIPADVMVNKVQRVKANLGLNLRNQNVRIVTAPGKSTIGIEVPNQTREMVTFRELLETPEFEQATRKMELPLAFGKDAVGNPVVRDLAGMPHLLVGGSTGQGKSVFENVVLGSLLMSRSPRDLRLIMVDPKQVEFTPYAEIPHLLAPVIDESRKAAGVFDWLVKEMERRYSLLKKAGVRKLPEYHDLPAAERRSRLEAAGADPDAEPDHLPYIVAIVDELADLMMVAGDTDIEQNISRIAGKARAAGIHLILVTQSPRSDVLTGLIKANVPARVSLRVNTGTESRIVLDQIGAEDLLGKGDLLMVMPGEPKALRAQSAFIADDEMKRLLDSLRGQMRPQYMIRLEDLSGGGGDSDDGASGGPVGQVDPMFAEAVDQILAAGRGSASFLRTAMALGHTRATRLIIQMERAGILGPNAGSKERQILITFEEWEQRKASGDLTGQGGGDADVYDTRVAA
ncbi:MAG: DNA translocase FtsK [Planctomycetes bacterium]|nr:DNA translocase FtsK [Planctomycetota bacterium]